LTTSEFLTFNLAGQLFATPVADVREVLGDVRIAPVPGAASDLTGLVNVRGHVLCVLDLATRLGLDASGPGHRGVVVVEVGSELVGLAVDELLDVELLPPAAPVAETGRGRSPVVGTVDHGGQLFQLVDIKAAADPLVGVLELSEVSV